MRMRNCTVCSEAQLIGFAYNCFIYKLVKMVFFIVQTKAKLHLTKKQLVYNCVNFFAVYGSITLLWFVVNLI